MFRKTSNVPAGVIGGEEEKMKQVIPEEEQDNVLHMYWVLLAEVEMTLKKEDAIRKHTVSQAYDLLNRIDYTKERPRFEKP